MTSESRPMPPAAGGFHDWLMSPPSWTRIGLIFVAVLFCIGVFILRRELTAPLAKCDPGDAPDGRRWFRPEETEPYFEAIGPTGRAWYVATQWSVDLVFPLLYGGLFIGLAARWCSGWRKPFFIYATLAGVACDYGENSLLTCIALGYGDSGGWATHLAAGFTCAKFAALSVAWIGIAAGAIVTAWPCLERGNDEACCPGETASTSADEAAPSNSSK